MDLRIFHAFLLLLPLVFCFAQAREIVQSEEYIEKLCRNTTTSHATCGQCFASHQSCAWCQVEDSHIKGMGRCDSIRNFARPATCTGTVYQSTETAEKSSPKCNGHGTFHCGVCECEDGYSGSVCQCASQYKTSTGSDCIMEHSSVVCSGRGQCSCGVCDCHKRKSVLERVWGRYCECDNFSCDRYRGSLCGGPDHGECVCGRCACKGDWIGPACECHKGVKPCIGPNRQVCSGHGNCICGHCQCDHTYGGRFCDECPTCPGKCDEYKTCVQCQAFGTGELKDDCSSCTFTVIKVPEAKVLNKNERICMFTDDEDDSKFTFVYGSYENDRHVVRVQETKVVDATLSVVTLGLDGRKMAYIFRNWLATLPPSQLASWAIDTVTLPLRWILNEAAMTL